MQCFHLRAVVTEEQLGALGGSFAVTGLTLIKGSLFPLRFGSPTLRMVSHFRSLHQ